MPASIRRSWISGGEDPYLAGGRSKDDDAILPRIEKRNTYPLPTGIPLPSSRGLWQKEIRAAAADTWSSPSDQKRAPQSSRTSCAPFLRGCKTPSPSRPHTHAEVDYTTMKGLRVLIVDDEEDFRKTLAGRLEFRDLKPDTAVGGKEALEFVREQAEPAVMVLDLRLPGMDGLEVLRQTKKACPDIEVIILTGYGTAAAEAEARKLGRDFQR